MRQTATYLSIGAVALAAGAGGAGLTLMADDGGANRKTVTEQVATATRQPVVQGPGKSAGEVYRESKDAVAFIRARTEGSTSSPFGGSSRGTATGTGFVVDPKGLIVTNQHVVDDARSVQVKVGDGERLPAQIVGADPSSDLALLKVDTNGKGLPSLQLGDSGDVQVGDATYAIGNPYGLDRTLTTGVVSALRRTIQAPNGFAIPGALQTDAALNPGNSGGPLLDASGEVIGVNSQIETSGGGGAGGTGGNTGVGFAVPSDTVTRVVKQLEGNGKATHAFLGISSSDAEGATSGAVLGTVQKGGPADDAGLKNGDLVTEMGGTPVRGSDDLVAAVDAHQPGDRITVRYRRDGDTREATVTLGTRPARARAAQLPAP
jgi:putative serine protease PepD